MYAMTDAMERPTALVEFKRLEGEQRTSSVTLERVHQAILSVLKVLWVVAAICSYHALRQRLYVCLGQTGRFQKSSSKCPGFWRLSSNDKLRRKQMLKKQAYIGRHICQLFGDRTHG